MKRVGQLAVTILVICFFLFPAFSCETDDKLQDVPNTSKQGKGYRYNVQGWIYLHIEGDPYERGYQYGYLVADEIADSIERWKEFIFGEHKENALFKNQMFTENKNKDQLWELYKTKAERYFLEHVPEEYVKEMEGMADGMNNRGIKISGKNIEFEDILLSQFVQDIMYSLFLFPQKRPTLSNYYSAKVLSWFSAFGNKIYDVVFPLLKFSLRKFLSPREYEHQGHCSAFITTGEYTKDGGIVAAHSTIFGPLIAERCNLILNVKPTDGYSFTMTTFPGSIWSQEDWYQNEKGIILTETELRQGAFNIRKIPKGVRSRTAIQYSDSIDDVIDILQNGNNGLIPNEWLIGDTKTGEIASLEQAYFNTPIKRTKSGFYWSCNVPHDEKVLTELWGGYNFFGKASEALYDSYSMGRDKKFEEIKYEYNGKIDVEAAKEILAIYPICNLVTDGKITSSNLLKNNGLQVFTGNPNGSMRNPSDAAKEKYKYLTEHPALGWLEIYSSDINEVSTTQDKRILEKSSSPTDVIWNFDKESNKDFCYSSLRQSGNEIFAGFSSGELVVLSKDNGYKKWSVDIGEDIFQIEVLNDKLFVGSNNGLTALNKDVHTTEWHKLSDERVYSLSNVNDGFIFAGCLDGSLYAIDASCGMIDWSHQFEDAVYVSNIADGEVYLASGNGCYSVDYNGKIIWSFEADGLITSSPAYKDGKIFFGSWDNNVYCLNAKNGQKIWNFKTEWNVDATPEVTKDTVFVGALDHNLYALDKETGKLDWFFECNAAIHSNPVAYGDYVFFGCDDGRVYALDQDNGKNAWTYAPEYTTGDSVNNYLTSPILSGVTVDNGVLYFGLNDEIYALDAQTLEKPEKGKEDNFVEEHGLEILFIVLIIVGISLIFLSFYMSKKRGEQ